MNEVLRTDLLDHGMNAGKEQEVFELRVTTWTRRTAPANDSNAGGAAELCTPMSTRRGMCGRDVLARQSAP